MSRELLADSPAFSGGEPMFGRVAFIGIGLIGSSMARAISKLGLAREVVCSARSQATCDKALELGLVSQASTDAGSMVAGADLVVLCSPVGTYGDIAARIAPHCAPGAIVTDVGSVKQAVIRDVAPHLPEGVHLVPGHPVAGTEHSGPEAGFAELFENRWCILTPPPGANEEAVARVAEMWRRFGSNVEFMQASHHDKVLAITSHLPPDRLHHRRYRHRPGGGHQVRGDQVLGRRLPRFHPYRGQRSGHVARHLSEQPGSRAGDHPAVQRGYHGTSTGHPLG